MKLLFKRTILFALIAALGAASLPFFGVAAMVSGSASLLRDGIETSGVNNERTLRPQAELTNERLEKIWRRQLRAYEKFGKAEEFVEKAQALIDRAGANGKDVSAVQAALDAFEEAVKDAKPIYESANGIVNSHQGFDADGKVTDIEKATETVQQMGEKLKEIRDAMNGTGKALHEAIRAFREANPRPEKTHTP